LGCFQTSSSLDFLKMRISMPEPADDPIALSLSTVVDFSDCVPRSLLSRGISPPQATRVKAATRTNIKPRTRRRGNGFKIESARNLWAGHYPGGNHAGSLAR
jgi:hypothetical protein